MLAVPYPAVADIIASRGEQLAGKVVVDITNPLNFETFDSLVVPADSSATAEIAAALPQSRVLKAFNTTFAAHARVRQRRRGARPRSSSPATTPTPSRCSPTSSPPAACAPSTPARSAGPASSRRSASCSSPSPPARRCPGPAASPSPPDPRRHAGAADRARGCIHTSPCPFGISSTIKSYSRAHGGGESQPAGRRRGSLHQQRPQPRPPPCPAELPRCVDSRVGLHGRARHRRLPRRRRGGARSGRVAADGAVGDPRAAAVPLRRPRPSRARPRRRLDRARDRDGSRGPGRRDGRSTRRRLRAGGALDDRRHPVPAGPLRAASLALPHRARAGQRQRRPRHARLRGHAGRSAARGGAARGHRRRRGVRGGRCSSLWSAALLLRLEYDAPPRPSRRPGRSWSARRSRACGRSPGTATSRWCSASPPRSRSPGGADGVLGGGRRSSCWARGESGRRHADDCRRRRSRARLTGGVAPGGHPPARRLVRPRRGPVGAAARARRRSSPAGRGARLPRLRRRRQRADRRRRLHADGTAGARRGAGPGLRGAGEPGRGIHRDRCGRRPPGSSPRCGARAALVGIGLRLPGAGGGLVVAAARPGRHGRRARHARSGCSSGCPCCAPSRCPSVEQLARGLEPLEVSAGTGRCSARATSATATT